MEWKDLARLVVKSVPRGKVTTYGDLSVALYGTSDRGQPVAAMVKKWAREDPRAETHRIVHDDGALPDVGLHREKLQYEHVPFALDGKVDLEACKVSLPPKDALP
ncbi:MAG: cysteine methyltransferase [Pseudomonadota bacterium]